MQLAEYYYELYELDLLQHPYRDAILFNRIHHRMQPCAVVDLLRDLAPYSGSLRFDRIPTESLAILLRNGNVLKLQSVFLKENEPLHALIVEKILSPILATLARNPAVNEGDQVAVLSRLLQWVKSLSNHSLSYFLPKLLIKDNVEEMSRYLEEMMQRHVEMLERSEFTTIVEAYDAYKKCILDEGIGDNADARVMGIVCQETDLRFFTSPAARQRLLLRNMHPKRGKAEF